MNVRIVVEEKFARDMFPIPLQLWKAPSKRKHLQQHVRILCTAVDVQDVEHLECCLPQQLLRASFFVARIRSRFSSCMYFECFANFRPRSIRIRRVGAGSVLQEYDRFGHIVVEQLCKSEASLFRCASFVQINAGA